MAHRSRHSWTPASRAWPPTVGADATADGLHPALSLSIFDALGIGLLLLDEQRRVCLLNDSLAHTLGVDPRAAVGSAVARLLPQAWLDELQAAFAPVDVPVRSPATTPARSSPRLTLTLANGASRSYVVEVRFLDARRMLLVAVRAIDEVRVGSPSGMGDRRGATAAASPRLSPREQEVLRCIAEGSTTKDIASLLGIAPTTVDTYRRQIMRKLQLRTIAELTKYAVRERLTPP
ncbi:MAG TPA: LuxR C-terminal-related transcriptional regulator [Polyangiaceae bacterium]|nr:LuxR C-terminal-related transcriptional regulator [Polyangiaceae bacterium]